MDAIIDGGAEGPHPDAGVEEWVFAAWTPDGALGVVSGHRLIGRTAWYWAALARTGRQLLHVADFEVPVRKADPFIVKGEQLWAEHTLVEPMKQWTIGNETYASALDDPDDALGRAYGDPTPIAFDLEWYATAPAQQLDLSPDMSVGYEQSGVVHGAIDLLGEPRIVLTEVPAKRWHRWATTDSDIGPLALPVAVAHTGVRAPFAFPGGAISDLVLTRSGWNQRGRPSRP